LQLVKRKTYVRLFAKGGCKQNGKSCDKVQRGPPRGGAETDTEDTQYRKLQIWTMQTSQRRIRQDLVAQNNRRMLKLRGHTAGIRRTEESRTTRVGKMESYKGVGGGNSGCTIVSNIRSPKYRWFEKRQERGNCNQRVEERTKLCRPVNLGEKIDKFGGISKAQKP